MSSFSTSSAPGALLATREITSLIDDIDGTPAASTVEFGLDGQDYVIDLSRSNRNNLIRDLARYMAAARPVGGSGPPMRVTTTDADPRAVREWARANGVPVPEGKRVPRSVIDQFIAAGN